LNHFLLDLAVQEDRQLLPAIVLTDGLRLTSR
jgi:hypothetical protein